MNRQQAADALEEAGLLLDLLGENAFKTRAYHNAARVLRALEGDLDELVRSGRIRDIRGIGAALAGSIAELATTGSLARLDALRRDVPAGLLEWLRIPGLGPKKARAIWVHLGITSLDELEAACRAGTVRDLEGFGATSEAKILDGIARVRSHAGRFLQPVVRAAATILLDAVRGAPGVVRAEAAGSVRRRLETSKDVDLVVEAAEAGPVMDAFVAALGVESVTGRGPTKCSVRLASGLAADLRVVDAAAFPFALQYFTGSKAHNIALRARAQRLGFRLNEYGLVGDTGVATPCGGEAELYAALGLSWIPPELREDQGEIAAAESGDLPVLVEDSDLRGVLHCHSTWSDGAATIAAMADAARTRGLAYLGISDHSQSAGYARGLSAERLLAQRDEIEALNRSYGGAFRILHGVEADILADGSLDYPHEVLARLDFVIGSVHSRFQLSADEQTARMVKAVGHPYLDILGHPTGRLLLEREPYPLHLHQVVDAAIAQGVVIEVNAHPSRLDIDWTALRHGLARGLVTALDPDAHDVEGIGDMAYGVGVARKAWATRHHVLNALPLERVLEHLAARRARARARPLP